MFKVKDWFSSRSWKRLVQCVFETSRRYSDISQQRENLLKKTRLVSRRYSDISNQSKTCFLTVFGVLSAAKRLF